MKAYFLKFAFAMLMTGAATALAAPAAGKHFDRAIFVIFENTNYDKAIKQSFFKELADQGAHLFNFTAMTHPSQGNYVALTSGSLHGVVDDRIYDLNVDNIVDLLEAQGLTWKVYAEGFPGHCFTGATQGRYARKHNPFISYMNIQKNPARCANIVDSAQFDIDARQGSLANYVFYVPDLSSDGHDTGVTFADNWYRRNFTPYLKDPRFMANTIVISTFDESAGRHDSNQIYTSIVGPNVKATLVPTALNTYSLLKMIEDNWNLGDLGLEDAKAVSVPDIWQN